MIDAAASARLCVETSYPTKKRYRHLAAASARLCVETDDYYYQLNAAQAAASARLCVETTPPLISFTNS